MASAEYHAAWYQANKERLAEKRRETRRARKQRAVEYLGGACMLCGYDRSLAALDFHHEDPDTKSFNLGRGGLDKHAWTTIQEELDKCILLCANCHREHHDADREGGDA